MGEFRHTEVLSDTGSLSDIVLSVTGGISIINAKLIVAVQELSSISNALHVQGDVTLATKLDDVIGTLQELQR